VQVAISLLLAGALGCCCTLATGNIAAMKVAIITIIIVEAI
jgi:hypothetical protein